jgi:hypothetical protein
MYNYFDVKTVQNQVGSFRSIVGQSLENIAPTVGFSKVEHKYKVGLLKLNWVKKKTGQVVETQENIGIVNWTQVQGVLLGWLMCV